MTWAGPRGMTITRWEPTSLEWWIRRGASGGLAGGLLFAVYLMMFAALMHGMGALFTPLRAVGAIVLGPQALDGHYPLLVAGTVGALVHLAFSVFFGVVFAALLRLRLQTRVFGMPLPVSASMYGLVLWVVNFHVIAPAAGWPWLPDGSPLTAQFLAHAVAFGAVLGTYLNRALRQPGWAIDLTAMERWQDVRRLR